MLSLASLYLASLYFLSLCLANLLISVNWFLCHLEIHQIPLFLVMDYGRRNSAGEKNDQRRVAITSEWQIEGGKWGLIAENQI